MLTLYRMEIIGRDGTCTSLLQNASRLWYMMIILIWSNFRLLMTKLLDLYYYCEGVYLYNGIDYIVLFNLNIKLTCYVIT